ncbi:MAG: hypothetical protein ACOCV8_00950 [Spirochaetota bacterium]
MNKYIRSSIKSNIFLFVSPTPKGVGCNKTFFYSSVRRLKASVVKSLYRKDIFF